MAAITTEPNKGWHVKQTDNSFEDDWLPVQKVPTVIHLDLQENGKIPDPFVDMNELAVRWVAEKSWTYRTTFPDPTTKPHGARTDLVFKGLDTFAKVTLNGKKILEADNMFLEYRVDVTNHLQGQSATEANVLEVVLKTVDFQFAKLNATGFDVVPGEEVVVQITGGKVEAEEVRWTYIGAESGSIGITDIAK